MEKKLKLLSKLINIDNILNGILDTNDTDLDIILSLILDNEINEDFLNLIAEKDRQTFINKTINEKITFYKKTKDKLNNVLRYNLLNYNVEKELEQLKKYNPFAYQNFQEIIILAISDILEYKDSKEEDIIPFPIEKTLNIIKAYLKEIDKSNKLYNLFQEKIVDGSILLWKKGNENEELKIIQSHKELILDTKSWKVFNEEEKLYINAPYDNTILDIYRLIHEFIHLYIYSNKENILEVTETETFFEEFPPIYYETMLKNYLIKIGFPDNIAEIAIKEREKSYINDIHSLITLKSLIKIKEQRLITQSDLESFYNISALKEKTRNFNEAETKKYYQEMEKCGINLNSVEETANNICDHINTNIISYEYTEHKRINYVIAKLLTEEINKKSTNNSDLKNKVLYITSILGTTEKEPNEILEFLECENLFKNTQPPQSIPHTKQKNINPKIF